MNYKNNFGSDEGIFMMHNTWPSFLNGCVSGRQTLFNDIHLHNAHFSLQNHTSFKNYEQW